MKRKPSVAILRGPLLSPFEMQAYRTLARGFDLTAFVPHRTRFDLSGVPLKIQSLWCPLESGLPFQDAERCLAAFRNRWTGSSRGYCGLAERLAGFDLLHTADTYYCFSYEAALVKRRSGAALVTTQWENIPHKNERGLRERYAKRTVLAETDLFLAVSEGAKGALTAEGVDGSRIRKVYPGVDTRHFRPGLPDRRFRDSLGLPAKAWVVLFAGRLSRDKGVFTLLEAFRSAAARIPDAHLLLAGKDEDGVGKAVERLGLAGRAHLAGPVPYDRMPVLYRQADLFVLPSLPRRGWMEQFGMVLAEAMACGVPVLGSRSGAIPEVVGEENRLFPSGDAAALAAKLLQVRRGNRKAAAGPARRRAQQLFSVEASARGISAAYREALCNAAGRGQRHGR